MICKNCGSNVSSDNSVICPVCGEQLADGNVFEESTQTLSLFEIGLRKQREINSEKKHCILTDNIISKAFGCPKRTDKEFKIIIDYENGSWYIDTENCQCFIDRIAISGKSLLNDRSFIKICIDTVPIYAFKVRIRKNHTKEELSLCPYCGLNAVRNCICQNCRRQVRS